MKKVIVITDDCRKNFENKLNKIYQQYKVKDIKYNTTRQDISYDLIHSCILIVKEKNKN